LSEMSFYLTRYVDKHKSIQNSDTRADEVQETRQRVGKSVIKWAPERSKAKRVVAEQGILYSE
jgi:hypothetical protein